MKPLDPRLLRYATSARGVLGVGGLLGVLRTLAVIAWCWCLAQGITALVLPVLGGPGDDGSGAYGSGTAGRVGEGSLPLDALPAVLGIALLALLLRAASSWAMDALTARGAVRVKRELRSAALDALDARSPEALAGAADAAPAIALGRGLDALDGYFTGYLPQLILAACATPLLVLAVLLADPVSGATVLIVFPVIPLFMVLIGLATRSVQQRQWGQLQRLSGAFLDVVEGLATLKIFRREGRQVERIARETGEYRSRTMQVLRVTFLSGFVLDLAGTFSIALVAVTVGTRLVVGEFPLALGLFVLLLLPEVFLPIRQVGAAFHASTEGLAAASEVFALIEGSTSGAVRAGGGSQDFVAERRGKFGRIASRFSFSAAAPLRRRLSFSDVQDRTSENATRARCYENRNSAPIARVRAHGAHPAALATERQPRIAFDGVVVERGGRVVVGPVSFGVRPGEIVALTGPSGSGKSTLVSALLGFVEPSAGRVVRSGELAWAGQRPGLLQGTVAANVALGDAEPDPQLVAGALEDAALPDLDPQLRLGAQGAGLSGGQAQRVAIARALYRARRHDGADGARTALVLDEPSSALDAEREARVAQTLRREAEAGRAVLLVSHRPALIAAADRAVRLDEFPRGEAR